MSAIVATSLTQRYGSEVALDGVDLAVDAGEHLAVLGENGAGKTTLLRILATAARPTSGTLEMFGLDALVERRRLRARIGYVAHAPGLYPALSAAENLAFFCTLQGVDRGRVAEVLDLVGLAELASRLAAKLSRGAQQRLSIGRSVLQDPKLLVLDEPDASHDHALANRLCQRTVELRRGRVAGVPTRLRVVH